MWDDSLDAAQEASSSGEVAIGGSLTGSSGSQNLVGQFDRFVLLRTTGEGSALMGSSDPTSPLESYDGFHALMLFDEGTGSEVTDEVSGHSGEVRSGSTWAVSTVPATLDDIADTVDL